MAKTRHMHQRMGQRAITQAMLDIVSKYGMSLGDKRVLDNKNIDSILRCMDKVKKDLLRVRDKGGLVVVEANDVQITAYRVDSYDCRRAV